MEKQENTKEMTVEDLETIEGGAIPDWRVDGD